jgi:Flp pilus assembly protein TadB
MQNIEQYLIDKADQCNRLARAGREMADSLEAMGNDLMAKAVALDSARDRVHKDERAARAAKRNA